MLQLIKTLPGTTISEFRQEVLDNGMPDLMSYNPELGEFSVIRTVLIDTGWEEEKLKDFLKTHKDACIWNTLSHKPISDTMVMIDGEPYIDLFGLNVYISSNVAWYPHKDIDYRFNNDEYPHGEIVDELYDYFDR